MSWCSSQNFFAELIPSTPMHPTMVISDPSGWAWVLSVIGNETQVL
jgi:hypothetical protein